MPQKTKKQKLLAQLHRKINLLSPKSSDLVKREFPDISSKKENPQIFNYSYNKQVVSKPQTLTMNNGYSYFKSDVIKITIFTFLALIFQGVLYFILRTR